MSEPLPAGGPDREIFLRALRNYSEACEPPELTPGCPFAVVTPTGRGCLEECVDLLGRYGAPGPVEEISVGEFSIRRVRRSRARRGPGKASKPFDAREIHLADVGQRLPERATVSLLWELRDLLTDPPPTDVNERPKRSRKITGCMEELARRGFDSELVVRHGMAPTLAAGMAFTVVLPMLGIVAAEFLPSPPPGWAEFVLGPEAHSADSDQLMATAGRSVGVIAGWLAAEAPIDDIINWAPPSRSEVSSLNAIPDDVAAPHRWIVHRFLETYLEDWTMSSLRLEWLWLRGEAVPMCPSREMAARRISETDLSKVIADRSVKNADRSENSIPVERFTRVAVDLLMEGGRDAAASLFRAILDAEPNNAQAHNNLGFCIMPDDAAGALLEFDRAASLGLEFTPMVIGNRIYALAALGRATSALDLAERLVERFHEIPEINGWMWAFEGDPKLLEVNDIRRYALDLAVHIAEGTGDAELLRVWVARRTALL